MNTTETTTNAEHEHPHRVAHRRFHRQLLVERAGWCASAALLVTGVATGGYGFLLAAAVPALAVCGWLRFGHVDTGAGREANARRAEFTAYYRRANADSGGVAATEYDPHRDWLCQRIDVAEARLPWWVRTGT